MQYGIPPEIAWIVPLAIPFVIGLLTGVIIRRGIKLIAAIIGLLVILVGTGYVSLSYEDLYSSAMEVLPKLFKEAKGSAGNVLPISAPSFLVGLGIGLWIG
ncbi:hypothetical protein AKJ37_03455 [candidate division MSBL1 archaeon SCGC-AAA259I09]|uniref:Uncharacterized protein n=2 Tax=candidate division MSBL1 TaxID=215777 RepID=A0A133USY9_9EURY|nr:hypothetical protein AKJ37_03455 [candidate division MSBL1 archaeon SCGC-AAA259I09]KXA98265.1 hypothetical protein AKJ39_02350 [candidate division MSBL1 archaeon SCGC-AAA259J03]